MTTTIRRVPKLGPVLRGGRCILDQDLTHPTSGLKGYPAFDDGFGRAGASVIAPEALEVTKIGSTVRRNGKTNGKSVHALGASGIKYWFGHLEQVPKAGDVLGKGAKIGVISPNHEVPHVHVGIDARALIGHELVHKLTYAHGAPSVGLQLKAHVI